MAESAFQVQEIPEPRPIPPTRLRPRQGKALREVFRSLQDGVDKQLVALPTGVGKTLLAAHVALRFEKVLFLVHREELLEQTVATFERVAPGTAVGVIRGKSNHDGERFSVGMIQTVYSRLGKIDPSGFDLVILDECHHAAARTWRAVADHFQPRLRLGLSATPERGDGKPLNDLFSKITYQMNLSEAVQEGLLVRPRALQVETGVSVDRVKVVAGDFSEGQLGKTLNTEARNRLLVETYLEHAKDRKALVFCSGVEHSKGVARAFQEAGVKADWVSGDDRDRTEKVQAFKDGRLNVLANAYILVEGFDDPSVGAILMARPLLSRPMYAQIIGRGLRLDEDKRDCLIFDFVDASKKHYLLSAWRFFGIPEPKKNDQGEPLDVLAQPANAAQRSAMRLAECGVEIDWAKLLAFVEEVNLFAPPPVDANLYHHGGWRHDPVTEKQRALLEAAGYDPSEWTKGQAALFISSMPPSPKQLLLLLALGYDVLNEPWTRNQADKAFKDAKEKELKPDWKRVNRVGARLIETRAGGLP